MLTPRDIRLLSPLHEVLSRQIDHLQNEDLDSKGPDNECQVYHACIMPQGSSLDAEDDDDVEDECVEDLIPFVTDVWSPLANLLQRQIRCLKTTMDVDKEVELDSIQGEDVEEVPPFVKDVWSSLTNLLQMQIGRGKSSNLDNDRDDRSEVELNYSPGHSNILDVDEGLRTRQRLRSSRKGKLGRRRTSLFDTSLPPLARGCQERICTRNIKLKMSRRNMRRRSRRNRRHVSLRVKVLRRNHLIHKRRIHTGPDFVRGRFSVTMITNGYRSESRIATMNRLRDEMKALNNRDEQPMSQRNIGTAGINIDQSPGCMTTEDDFALGRNHRHNDTKTSISEEDNENIKKCCQPSAAVTLKDDNKFDLPKQDTNDSSSTSTCTDIDDQCGDQCCALAEIQAEQVDVSQGDDDVFYEDARTEEANGTTDNLFVATNGSEKQTGLNANFSATTFVQITLLFIAIAIILLLVVPVTCKCTSSSLFFIQIKDWSLLEDVFYSNLGLRHNGPVPI